MTRVRRQLSEKTKYKMKLAKLGRKNPMFGKHHTTHTKKQISEAMKKYWRTILE